MDATEARLRGRVVARKAAQYFHKGDVVQARFFFTVLKEVMEELAQLEAEADAARRKRDRLMSPRKPWFERP